MKIFDKPKKLNGSELIAELKEAGIIVTQVFDFANGTIGFVTEDESMAATIVDAHNGTTVAPELTVADKLASVGLSLPDLKAALGL